MQQPPVEDKASDRTLIARQAALQGWANTANRTARMSKPQHSSPAHVGWHAKRLGLDPDNLSPDELKRAECARRSYMIAMSRRAQQSRQRKKARRLRMEADHLDALANADPDDVA